METVSFCVEWLSESRMKMTYDDGNNEFDEKFIIEIP